jgi:fructan beta-fructosidase
VKNTRTFLTALLLAPLAALNAADSPAPATYDEPNRPQLHFTPAKGWLNDPVGMFYHKGEYHLHYLGAPGKANGMGWGDTWVHLVSKDMLHWQELAPSVSGAGGSIGGGSVVVDAKNSSGLQSGDEKPLVLFWNSMKSIPGDGFVGGPWRAEQKVHTAHSTDRGRTWTPSTSNPILASTDGNADFRDPSVFWHEATQRWVMLVCRGYHDFCDVFTSADLKSWNRVGKAPNGEEPRLLQLPVRGTSETKWVFLGGDYPMSPPQLGGKYFIGDFDGKNFTAESGARRLGGNHFVGSSINHMPDNRQIWMGWKWLRDEGAPGPWTGGPVTIPVELTLGKDPEEELCLFYSPAKELQTLRQQPVQLRDQTIGENSTLLTDKGIKGELFEVIAEFEIGKAKEFGIEFCKGPGGSFKIGYEVSGRKLTLRDPSGHELLSQLLLAKRGRVKLHLLLDRTMLDAFGNDGITWNCAFFKAEQPAQQGIELYAKGGPVKLLSLDLWPLKSVWK